MGSRHRDGGAGSSTAAFRRRDWNTSAGTSSAAGAVNSKKSALSAAYAELGKELTSGKLRSVGTYTLGRPIGEGTYGKVRLGTHRLTGLRVAIKQVPKAHSANLTREIHHHRHLHHPNIMQLYEVLATESYIWMVAELCSGGELYDYLVERGTMPEPEARRIFGQLCLAVAYIHERGIVHRDLKLENVLLDERCNVKLGDFGFTREFEGKRLMETFCGTTGYAAPEMLAGRPYTGEEVDIWSLGIILYALVYGALPFDDDDEAVMKYKILHGDYDVPDTVSPECVSLIKSILQKDPTARPSIKDIFASSWFTKIIMPPLAMETVDEDITDGRDSPTVEDEHVPLSAASELKPFLTFLASSSENDTAKEQSTGSSGISSASFTSAASQPESETSDHHSSNTVSTAPTTAGGTVSDAHDEPTAPASTNEKPMKFLQRNESQTTIKRQASASSDGSRKATLMLPRSTSTTLTTHVENAMESHSPDEPISKSGLPQSVALEKRGSQSSARSAVNHRTPSRTKRRSSSGLSDHHPPSLESRPVDYMALLERSTPAIFSTVLEQNLLHQLSTLGMDVGQIVHSVVNEACDASGAMWWLLKKKEEERARIESEAGLGSMPSSPYIPQVRNLSPAPSLIRGERQKQDATSPLSVPQAAPPTLSITPDSIFTNNKAVEAKPQLVDATTSTSKRARAKPIPEKVTLESSPQYSVTPQLASVASTSDVTLDATSPSGSKAASSPARNRASSLSARISSVLSGGRDKDRDAKKEPLPDATGLGVTLGVPPSEKSASRGTSNLFSSKSSLSLAGIAPIVSERRSSKEDAKEKSVETRTSVSSADRSEPSTTPQKKQNRASGFSMLEPSRSEETFSTVTSSSNDENGSASKSSKKSGKSSFLTTVRTWLGTEEKKSDASRQKKTKNSKKTHLTPIQVHHPTQHVVRSGSVRRQALSPSTHPASLQHVASSGSHRHPTRSSVRGTLSRTSSSGSTHVLPMSSRPVSVRRPSAGSLTPTATMYTLGDDYLYSRHSRPSSAQSHHRASLVQAGLHGKGESMGGVSTQLRMQRRSSGSAGVAAQDASSLRGARSNRSSMDGGTTVRRHRHYPQTRSDSRSHSRPSTPTRSLQQSGDFSVDTLTPRRSVDSGRGSPSLSSRNFGSGHSVFVAHRSRHAYKPPSLSPTAHRMDISDEHERQSSDGAAHSHARARGVSDSAYRYRQPNPHVGTWRRSWGKPPPTWSGPVDHVRDDGAASRVAEAQARDKAKLRDIFAKRDAEDEWEDEEDDPIYAGGLGQLASSVWSSGQHDSRDNASASLHSSPRIPGGEAHPMRSTLEDSFLSNRRMMNTNRALFQPPSLGRETMPRSWVPMSVSDADKDGKGKGKEEDTSSSETNTMPRKDIASSTTPTAAAAQTTSAAAPRLRTNTTTFKGPNTITNITEEEEDDAV